MEEEYLLSLKNGTTHEEDSQEVYCSSGKLELSKFPSCIGHSCRGRKWNPTDGIIITLLLSSGAWLLVFSQLAWTLDGLDFSQGQWDPHQKNVNCVCTFIRFNTLRYFDLMSEHLSSFICGLAVANVLCKAFRGLQSSSR